MILSVELCYELVPSEQSPLILYNQLTNNPFIFFSRNIPSMMHLLPKKH